MLVASEMDLQEMLNEGSDNIPATQASYAVTLKKFSKFVETDEYNVNGAMIKKEFFTDDKIAKFLISLGIASDHKPHALKSARAALGYALSVHALPNMRETSQLYPNTTRAIAVINY